MLWMARLPSGAQYSRAWLKKECLCASSATPRRHPEQPIRAPQPRGSQEHREVPHRAPSHVQTNGAHQFQCIAALHDTVAHLVIEAHLAIFQFILEMHVDGAPVQFIGHTRQR